MSTCVAIELLNKAASLVYRRRKNNCRKAFQPGLTFFTGARVTFHESKMLYDWSEITDFKRRSLFNSRCRHKTQPPDRFGPPDGPAHREPQRGSPVTCTLINVGTIDILND